MCMTMPWDVGGGKAPTFGQFVCDINAMDSSV